MTSPSKKTLHAAEQDRPDVAAERAALKAEQPKLRAPRLVFIDETAVTTKMARHHGQSPRGERLVAGVPHGHWKMLTLVAALRIDGLTAPYVIDGAMDGPSFLAYVEQVLVPTLRKATSSSWTTCAPTRSPVSARPSRLSGLACATCRRTRPTSRCALSGSGGRATTTATGKA
jgi:hypothetical protein